MAAAVAARARRRWCEATRSSAAQIGSGIPPEPFLPPPRAGAPLHPSPCLRFHCPRPGSPTFSSSLTAVPQLSPDISFQGPAQPSKAPTHTPSWASPGEAWKSLSPIPCRELDVDRRRRVDPGEAPKLEPVFGLRHCPLPPALQLEEHPFPAPSSSLGWCRMQSDSCKWGWGQALASAGEDGIFSCSLDLSLRSPTSRKSLGGVSYGSGGKQRPAGYTLLNDASLLPAFILGVHSDWAKCTNCPGLSAVTHQLLPHPTFKYTRTGEST